MTQQLQDALAAVKEAVYHENGRGGEARLVVAAVAQTLGVELSRDPLNGERWSPVNMNRVVLAAEELMAELKSARERLASREATINIYYRAGEITLDKR